MITDAVKDYLVRKRFGIVGYLCVIVHFLCGLVCTVYTAVLSDSENAKFSCSVDAKSTNVHKKQVDQSCFTRYDQMYNSPLPLYGFVLLSIGSGILVSVIYSQIVSNRVDEIESSHERQNGDEAERHESNRRTEYVFYSYFFHLVFRAFLGIIFTVLQYTYFYSNGFPFKFKCNYNSTVVPCENATASRKRLSGILVCVTNSIVAFVIFVEVIYLLRRLIIYVQGYGWNADSEFVTVYFLGKRYGQERGRDVPLQGIETNSDQDNSIQDSGTQETIHFYKTQVLDRTRAPEINYLPKTSVDDFYIDVVIHTERAKHKFSKDMERHEIYDVYMKVPPTSIRLEKIKDLFRPNKDTKGKVPRSILAIGRPGIGKTVLTEKITRDWANNVNYYYDNKIAILFKFRWFNGNVEELYNISLKKFLQLGTRLSDDEFERIYEVMTKEPQRVILIFDGLDEFYGNYMHCLDESNIIPDNPNTRMSAMNLFVKLFQGNMLKGATILVTSRPTADDFYSKLNFDREVEILGFTHDKIKEYVIRFCNNNNTSELQPKIWQHIKSNSELLNLCYIPVNCFIVCITLSGCLSDSQNDTSALPTTLTELYQAALRYFEKYEHNRNADAHHLKKETLQKLQQLAFLGMEKGQLIFDQELLDEQMVKSCLLNSLSDTTFPIQAQFCFIHLTIQEFLAAKHVTETLDASEVKEFISGHITNSKWHLVLQFTAGLLGKKIKETDQELYKDCVLAFADILEDTFGLITLSANNVFVMKCLKEGDLDDEIVQKICETTGMKNVTSLSTHLTCNLTTSEWAAVIFVCKHLENLVKFHLDRVPSDCFQEVEKLLRGRCIQELKMRGFKVEAGRVFRALTELNCKLNHNHTNFTSLSLHNESSLTVVDLSDMYSFFSNENASHLKTLHLGLKMRPRNISRLCEVFNNDYCAELTELELECYEGTTARLWDSLCKELCKLTKLTVLTGCSLADQYTENLCNALQDERCQLTDLSLQFNCISYEGARMLFGHTLTKKHCKLTKLELKSCFLTEDCIPSLCKALQDKLCRLTELSLEGNHIGDKGACTLFEVGVRKEHCKLTKLHLVYCSLTDQCMPGLCKLLQDERCQLTTLSLATNAIGDEAACTLFENGLTNEHCKLTKLDLSRCSLTDQCIPSLLKVLQDKHCGLNELRLSGNKFTEDSKQSICEVDNTSKMTVVNWR